ncbi:hypothetical protein HDV00_007387 [Rhizophlyctis rosea]|nr:hypothetical protein HDV00_007387 [Rhizophlyctis rosea]
MDLLQTITQFITLGFDTATARQLALEAKEVYMAGIKEAEAQRKHQKWLAEQAEMKIQANIETLPRRRESSTPSTRLFAGWVPGGVADASAREEVDFEPVAEVFGAGIKGGEEGVGHIRAYVCE